jgi:enamine deaminase RidA (YjgF/YER057c/UK114 family)
MLRSSVGTQEPLSAQRDVKPRISWADRADLLAAWEVVEDRFGRRGPPSTLLGVAALGFPNQLVEIEAVANLPA